MGDGNWHNFDAPSATAAAAPVRTPDPMASLTQPTAQPPTPTRRFRPTPATALCSASRWRSWATSSRTAAARSPWPPPTPTPAPPRSTAASSRRRRHQPGRRTGSVTINGGTLEVTNSFISNRTVTAGPQQRHHPGRFRWGADAPDLYRHRPGIFSSGGNLTKTGAYGTTVPGAFSGQRPLGQRHGDDGRRHAFPAVARRAETQLALHSAGFNQDVVWATSEATPRSGPPPRLTAGSGAGNVFYEAGTPFTPGGGLPNSAATNRTFVSQTNSSGHLPVAALHRQQRPVRRRHQQLHADAEQPRQLSRNSPSSTPPPTAPPRSPLP